MNTRNKSSAAARPSNIATILLLLLAALAPATMIQAQQQDQPNSGTGRRGARGDSPATPASVFGGGGGVSGGGFAGGRDRGGFGSSPMSRTPVLGEGPTCTFSAILYDVRMPAEQIGRLDVAALANAADSADAFEKALSALGAAKPMYRADQSVRLSGDTISIGAQVPHVVASSMTANGQTMNTISYAHTGAIFSLAGKADAAGFDLDLNIEVSSTLESALQNGDAKSPIIHSATLSHKGPVQPRKSFIVVTVDAGSLDKDGKAVAYIGRVTVGEPQAPAAR